MAIAILAYWAIMSVIAIMGAIISIGKPRKPVTPGFAAAVTLLGGLNLAAYVYLSTQL